jgi:hypothetical protein
VPTAGGEATLGEQMTPVGVKQILLGIKINKTHAVDSAVTDVR